MTRTAALTPAPARVGIFRALVLGDLLCAVPALRALRRAWPDTLITLIGLPWAGEWAARCPHLDRFIAFPGYPGLPEHPPDVAAFPAFLQTVQEARFDLVLQMHGSGLLTNPLVSLFGGARTAGFVAPGALPLDIGCPWPTAGREVDRLLALVDRLGLPRAGEQLEFPLRAEDADALAAACPELAAAASLVCIHPGAQLPSRRWLPERFAAVADALADDGHTLVFTGTAGERALVDGIVARLRRPALNLAGRTSLFTLGALLARARLLVCNDTGVSHVAAALGTPSVVVSLGADVARWAPRDTARHTVLWQDMACRPCAHRHCPIGHGCATAMEAPQVLQAARALLAGRTAAREMVPLQPIQRVSRRQPRPPAPCSAAPPT
jgi:ADP-heptose:LPS heptosyltransferase